ncbi:uncharacterized protein LOC141647630 [Silene latifolia]|uniref:uncharacterized protein LOC141647630 n=1 Tax=Silene latifolia TaxID=37657 RepID=UPI003D76F267
MTSCDDDFSLLATAAADDHQNQHFSHHRYHPRSDPPNDAVFVNHYDSADFDPDHDPDPDPNPDPTAGNKRKDRDDVSDGGTPAAGTSAASYYKKVKSPATASASSAEFRKDREEWSDTAIECLLDAYTDKYTQLNRGNLRGRDWEEVAAIVSERCENLSKSVEQCKNKVDNLKKRYKLERHRMTSAGLVVSHWPWFKKMEAIVGNSPSSKAVSDEEKVGGPSSGRPQKRYPTGTPGPLGPINNVKSKSVPNTKWQRVVFKISGAALAGNGPHNVDPKVVMLIAREIALAYRLGVQVAIVVGGRNFFCGDTWRNATGADRCVTYQIGMMATVMNSVLVQSALEKLGVQTRVQTAVSLPEFGEPYNRQRAIRHLEKGRVVIFGGIGGGSGNPLFSTDTTAALRASEIQAQAVIKGGNVDGFYDCTSRSNDITFEHISFREAGSRGSTSLDVMLLTLCEENGIPVVVFNLHEPGNISRALCGEQIGTLIDQTGIVSLQDTSLTLLNGVTPV